MWNIYNWVEMFKNCIYIHEINIQKGPALRFSANHFQSNKVVYSFKAAYVDIRQDI